MTPATSAADWDLTPFFPAPDSADFQRFRDQLGADLKALSAELDQAGSIAAERDAWVARLLRLEDVGARFGHMSTYLGCMGAADSGDDVVKRETARLAASEAQLDTLHVLVRAALAAASDAEMEALIGDERLADAAYFLRRQRAQGQQSMPVREEALAAELAVDGIGAWGRLYDQISGTLSFDLELPGKAPERTPVAMTRTLLEDADPAVRRAAFAGASKAWESVADVTAACLNAIAGTRHTLYRRRGIGHFLDPALFDAGISRATLDAMLEATRARQELARDYLRVKTRLLGMERLAFCDLMAPLPASAGGGDRIPWQSGVERVQGAFRAAYPALADLAARAIADRWVDYGPRPAKRPGGFCATSHVLGESRVFMTYNGAIGDVQTLAHELGHAFHGHVMRDQRAWSCGYPMTLAETASTFAENLVTDAALGDPAIADADKLRILDTRLDAAAAFLLNIPMRFDFEHALYEQRADGELSVGEMKELMLEAQRQNYGDVLDPEALDPWFWASKLHFYITEVSFYNFPYTFGYLFSMGLFARYKAEGAAFLPRYEALLRRTGSAPAEEVARESIGVDLERPEFWNASIDLVAEDFARYRELAGA